MVKFANSKFEELDDSILESDENDSGSDSSPSEDNFDEDQLEELYHVKSPVCKNKISSKWISIIKWFD